MNVIRLQGNCLSGGKSLLEIRAADQFALFMHDGSQEESNIEFNVDNITVDNHAVSVGDRARVHVVEHLFSTLYALGLFDVRIDLYGHEIPFFDGSSLEFLKALKGLPNHQHPGIRLTKPITVKHRSGSLVYTPWENDELHVEMSLTHTHIGRQKINLQIDAGSYENEIAAARTFVFTDEDDPRLERIPDYGIGITERNTYSATPLRFADEPVRHKILDLLGDMYVLNSPIYGTIQGENTHHWLNLQFMRKLISAMDGNDA